MKALWRRLANAPNNRHCSARILWGKNTRGGDRRPPKNKLVHGGPLGTELTVVAFAAVENTALPSWKNRISTRMDCGIEENAVVPHVLHKSEALPDPQKAGQLKYRRQFPNAVPPNTFKHTSVLKPVTYLKGCERNEKCIGSTLQRWQSFCASAFELTSRLGGVALHVKPDKMPELKRETFTA